MVPLPTNLNWALHDAVKVPGSFISSYQEQMIQWLGEGHRDRDPKPDTSFQTQPATQTHSLLFVALISTWQIWQLRLSNKADNIFMVFAVIVVCLGAVSELVSHILVDENLPLQNLFLFFCEELQRLEVPNFLLQLFPNELFQEAKTTTATWNQLSVILLLCLATASCFLFSEGNR